VNDLIENFRKQPRIISVVVDNDSWILPYAEKLVDTIHANGDQASLCRNYDEIREGLAAFYLGCTKITPPEILEKSYFNLVVHESDLPRGRGFAPMTWQILEGENSIVMCLIEAREKVDSGKVYIKKYLQLDGTELNDELRDFQGRMSVEICLEFLEMKEPPEGEEQKGDATYYPRRTPRDSELDVEKTIAEQFNLLRVVDNERYPAFFVLDGVNYILRIEKSN